MDEDQIYDDYLLESKEYTFPAHRYWKNGEVLGDNLDVFLNVVYGDPEVIGVTEEDDHWVANITKEGEEQEKKFLVTEYEVGDDGVYPYSEYPTDEVEEAETEMTPFEPPTLPDIPPAEETPMEPDESVLPDTDDSEDTQVISGEDNIEIDYGEDLKSEGSIEDIPEDDPEDDPEDIPEGDPETP